MISKITVASTKMPSRTPSKVPQLAIPLQPNHRILRLDRIGTPGAVGAWRVWVYTNDFVSGTYLTLHDNGMAELVTEGGARDDYDVKLLKEPDR